ncbi:winged helix-turn-helix domain-containing protein [Streptomyces megasporus]|uniref:winged helix-turn-helix domain-containing protein n=1 Tax=Streptomyces megasporus TaxID=44060 RepID=UPI000A9A6511|nr:winged helix-turn-helix domain-containing protein [Streptomyces megasporus]
MFGPLTVDLRTRQAEVDGKPVHLTRREFDLLAALLSDAGAVRQREDLINEVWDPNWHGSTRTLDVHIGSLRAKLGGREWIEAVRGVGFRLVLPQRV